MLPYVVVTLSSSPPPPLISSEQVCSSSSFESLIGDPKVVLDFFLGGEVTSLRLNLSLGVGDLYASTIDGTNVWVKVML
jgi:hypothetical protein